VSASMLFPIGTESDLRVRLRDVVADGSSTLGSTVLFNEVRYDAGTSLRVRPFLADGLIDLRLSVLDLGGGARLKLLAGLDFKYLDFKTWGTISAQSSGTDKNEDFYRQSLPLPSLGLGVTVPLSPDVFLEAEAFGFRAIGWDSGRPEGGTVYLTQDDFEASLGIVTRLAERWELAAGLRYDYLHINEYSLDDGNEFQLRNAGVFAAVRLRL